MHTQGESISYDVPMHSVCDGVDVRIGRVREVSENGATLGAMTFEFTNSSTGLSDIITLVGTTETFAELGRLMQSGTSKVRKMMKAQQ